jgi:hypothetical protein
MLCHLIFFRLRLMLKKAELQLFAGVFFLLEVHSIDIKNISNISLLKYCFFFSQLVIISKTFEENEIKLII